jgi:1-deoxy-D-xylulose-5-phosphate synthase
MLYTATTVEGPAVVRYPRGLGCGARIEQEMAALPIGKAVIRREGRSGLALLCFGTLLSALLETAEQLDATLVDMRFVKPLDVETLTRVALRSRALVTVEENTVVGGAGSAVAEALDAAQLLLPRLAIGIPDRFIDHGSREDCLEMAGLTPAALRQRIAAWWTAQHASARSAAAR